MVVYPRIVIHPEVQGGRPCIEGTRVPVHVLVDGVASGATVSDLREAYGVGTADVRAALRYAAATIEEQRLVALPRR